MDIGRSEQLESELDAMIERRARQKDPDEETSCGGLVAANQMVAQSRSMEHVLVRGLTEHAMSTEKPSGLGA